MAKRTKSKKEMFYNSMGFTNKEMFDSSMMNNVTFMDLYQQFMNTILTMFEWKNLPPTVDPRYLELQLFINGYIIFFEDDISEDIYALGGALSKPNIYGNMLERKPVAMNGAEFDTRTSENSVVVYNNYTRTPSAITTENYAKRLFHVLRTIDVNLNTMKTPIIVKCNQKNMLALKNAMMKYDGNEPILYVEDGTDLNGLLDVLNLSFDPRLTELNTYFNNVMSQGLTSQGIPVSSTDKKERQITSEVTQNSMQNLLIANSKLKARQEGADLINKMFGLDIEVEYSEIYQSYIDSMTGEGEEENGLYSTSEEDTSVLPDN